MNNFKDAIKLLFDIEATEIEVKDGVILFIDTEETLYKILLHKFEKAISTKINGGKDA